MSNIDLTNNNLYAGTETVRTGNTEPIVIGFHKPDEPYGFLSNWYPAEFDLDGQHYLNSEQYMMFRKVMLAGRTDLAERIMKTSSPASAKRYAGRSYFDNFSEIKDVWDTTSVDIVKTGVRAKFAQNPELLGALLDTGNAILTECSAQDKIWGNGISLSSDAWRDPSNWRGKSHLGQILMELREEFRNAARRDR